MAKVDLIHLDSIESLSATVTAQVVKVQDKYIAYIGGEGNTLESYEVNHNGHLSTVNAIKMSDKSGGIRGLISIKINNNDFLIVGNKSQNSIEVHQIGKNGILYQVSSVTDTDSTYIKQNVTTSLVEINGIHFIFAGGLDTGMSCFQLSKNGILTHIQSIADSPEMFLDGIIGMTSLVIDGKTYLFTGGFIDGGISSFRVCEDGTFKNVDNIKDNEKLFLNGAYPLNSVQLGNNSYVLAGHRHKIHYPIYAKEKDLLYHGDGINVFKVDSQGKLTISCLLKDNDQLKLKGSTRIEIIKISNQQAIVFIATRDDNGIQIALLNDKGILSPIKAIETNYSVYNGMTIEKIDNQWILIACGYKEHIINSYLIKSR